MDISKMHRGVLNLLLIVLSGVLSFLVIPSLFLFPSVGLAALFSSIAIFAFWAKKKKGAQELVALLAIILLSLFLVFRSNGFLNFLDIVTILILGSYYLFLPNGIESLLFLIASPFIALAKIATYKNLFPIKFEAKSFQSLSRFKFAQHIPAVFITILLLAIVIPLLSYANPFFHKLVNDFVKFLDLSWLSQFFTAPPQIYFARAIIFAILLFLFPRGISQQHEQSGNDAYKLKPFPRINLLLPRIVLIFVLTVFFVTQIELYGASQETLQAMGYTNSQLTREVFGQLSLVAFIIFLLMYADRNRNKTNNLLTSLLLLQGVFLCAIALKSDVDYVSQYGFTSKRLYGYAGVAWIFGLFVLFAYPYYKDEFRVKFITHLVAFSTFIVLCINLINFDYIIYHNDKPRVFGTDHVYLSGLSPDSDSYQEQIPNLMSLMRTETDPVIRDSYRGSMYFLVSKVHHLQQKYSLSQKGAFNLAEYNQYQKIRNVNVEKIYKYLETYQSNLQESKTPAITPLPSASNG